MSNQCNKPSKCELKIYIDPDGDVTITSLYRELLPLLKEISGISTGDKEWKSPEK